MRTIFAMLGMLALLTGMGTVLSACNATAGAGSAAAGFSPSPA